MGDFDEMAREFLRIHPDSQAAEIERIRARLAALLSQVDAEAVERCRQDFHARFVDWRGIEEGSECERCGGSGVHAYANTSTWRGGIGGQAITSDVCDKCWGSGDKYRSWTNLRAIRSTIPIPTGAERDETEKKT